MQVERSVVLEATPESVWSALTDPDRLASWFADDADIEVAVGGRATWTDEDGEARWGAVEVVEPARRLVLRWRSRRAVLGGRLAFELTPVDGGTLLTVTESQAAGPGGGSAGGRVLVHA